MSLTQFLLVDFPLLARLYTLGARYKKSLRVPFAKVWPWPPKLSNKKLLKKVFFCLKNPDLVHRPTAAPGRRGGGRRQK